MAESIVQVTEGTGKKLHTISYTVGANTVEDEVVVPGPYPYATYVLSVPNATIAVANDHLLCLNAGASLKVRVHRIRISQASNATAATVVSMSILRTTTSAPTGGTAFTPALMDTTSAASGAAGRSLPAAKGTESTILMEPRIVVRQAVLATSTQADGVWEWNQHPQSQPIIIPAGSTNGLAIKCLTASAAGSFAILVEFTETAF